MLGSGPGTAEMEAGHAWTAAARAALSGQRRAALRLRQRCEGRAHGGGGQPASSSWRLSGRGGLVTRRKRALHAGGARLARRCIVASPRAAPWPRHSFALASAAHPPCVPAPSAACVCALLPCSARSRAALLLTLRARARFTLTLTHTRARLAAARRAAQPRSARRRAASAQPPAQHEPQPQPQHEPCPQRQPQPHASLRCPRGDGRCRAPGCARCARAVPPRLARRRRLPAHTRRVCPREWPHCCLCFCAPTLTCRMRSSVPSTVLHSATRHSSRLYSTSASASSSSLPRLPRPHPLSPASRRF